MRRVEGAFLSEQRDVTQLLLDVQAGNRPAELLARLIDDELRRVARGVFSRERPGPTLQPTAVAHDVFMRLLESSRVDWQSRAVLGSRQDQEIHAAVSSPVPLISVAQSHSSGAGVSRQVAGRLNFRLARDTGACLEPGRFEPLDE